MERLESSLFDWLTWRAGSIEEVLKIPQREECLVDKAEVLRQHAIGWCPAELLLCRPKTDCVAVMFWVKERAFWTHLTKQEFNRIWYATK